MNKTSILEKYKEEVSFDEIVDFDKFDERMSAVDCIVPNCIGICDGFIGFCPENEPPTTEEILTWLWVCNPKLSAQIREFTISQEFLLLINSYESNKMKEFWDFMS